MADPLSPDAAAGGFNPMAIRPYGAQRDLTPGEAMATIPGGSVPNLAATLAASPELTQWLTNAHREMGTEQYGPNVDVARLVANFGRLPGPGLPYDTNISGPFTYTDKRPFDFTEAIAHGLGTSFLGGLRHMGGLNDALNWENDPDYDVWSDPQITKAGLANNYELFSGSRSSSMTSYLISQYNQHQREARSFQSMAGPASETSLLGGMLGDPLNYIPGSAGVRGLALAKKSLAGTLPGAERSLVMAGRPIYGALGDGLRNYSIMAAAQIAENAIANGFDPIARTDYVAGDIMVPSAISASLGMLLGASGRFSARLNMLASDARKANFLHGTLPAGMRTFEDDLHGARFVDPAFVGPTVPADREAAEALLHPHDLRGEGDFQRIEAARPRTENTGTGTFAAGSLATDYGDMVRREAANDPLNRPFAEASTQPLKPMTDVRGTPMESELAGHAATVEAKTGIRLVDREFKPGELPAADEQAPTGFKGATRVALADVRPGEFEPGKQGAMVIMPDGKIWRVDRLGPTAEEKAAALEEGRAGDHAAFFAHYPGLVGTTIPLTRFEDQLAAGVPRAGRTAQQEATLRALQGRWEREGLGDKAFLGLDVPSKAAIDTGEGSVGAAATPGSNLYREDVLLAQGRQKATGIGIEKVPMTPWDRAALGESVSMMELMTSLVSSGGRLLMGNFKGIPNLPPVEKMIEVIWNYPMALMIRHTADEWGAYRADFGKANGAMPTDVATLAQRGDGARYREQLGAFLKDRFQRGDKPLSFREFRERVGEAIRNDDKDFETDAATPYVERSAAKHREMYERTKAEAIEQGVFDEAFEKAKYAAYEDVRQVKKEADEIKARANIERWPADRERAAEEALMARMEDAEFRAKAAERRLQDLRDNGPTLNGTAPSYRPRMWDAQQLIEQEQKAVTTFSDWLQTADGGYHNQVESVRIAKQMHEILARQNPIFDRGDVAHLFMSVAAPTSAYARSFAIPDELVKDFLVKDSEVLMRFHTRQMGAAIEMKKRFGNLDLAEQVAEVERDYRNKIEAANAGSDVPTEEAIRLTAMMKQAIYDAQATRDKIYGTYGSAADPSRLSSRMIRMAKQYTNLTLLGMSGITALGDLVRPLMTEGIDAFYGIGLRSMMSESRAIVWKMAGHELELSGDGMDMIKNVRALAAADTGDVFGSRGTFERGLSQANSLFFVANGLNSITDFTKKWAAVNIIGRINPILHAAAGGEWASGPLQARFAHLSDQELGDLIGQGEKRVAAATKVADAQAIRGDIVDWQKELEARTGAGADQAMTNRDVARFAAAGIGPLEARRIGIQLQIHKEMSGTVMMPNTEKWTDEGARDIYRSALNQMVNRTVPTPGIGDRPNWMSTEWGSLIGQYKSFAVAAQVRQLQSGLQEGGSQFWYGAAAMVGFAVLLNEIRSRLFYDRSTFDKPPTAVIADAIDRSSILGWFSDTNRAVEALTGNRVGVKPLLGASQPRAVDIPQAVGAVAGPFAGQVARAAGVADDLISGHPTARTYSNWRTLQPGQNLPYLDPVMDRLYGSGSYHPLATQASRLNRAVAPSGSTFQPADQASSVPSQRATP